MTGLDVKEHALFVAHHFGSPVVGGTLVVAGFVPEFVDLNHLQNLYYLLLLFPTAGHCIAWLRDTIFHPTRKWFAKRHKKHRPYRPHHLKRKPPDDDPEAH